MQKQWQRNQVRQAVTGNLLFTEEQGRLMWVEIQNRANVQTAANRLSSNLDRHVQGIAQDPEQGHLRIDVYGLGFSIESERDGHRTSRVGRKLQRTSYTGRLFTKSRIEPAVHSSFETEERFLTSLGMTIARAQGTLMQTAQCGLLFRQTQVSLGREQPRAFLWGP